MALRSNARRDRRIGSAVGAIARAYRISAERSSGSFLEQPIEVERQPGNQAQPRVADDPQAGAIERAGHGPRRGDVMVVDAFESDRAKAQLHHGVNRRHAEKKTAARLEYARDLAESPRVLIQMLEDREADDEVELGGVVRKLVDGALDEPGGASVAAEPCLDRGRVGVEVDAVQLVHVCGDREQHRACSVAHLERFGVASIGNHPQSKVYTFAKESPDEWTLVVRDRIGWAIGDQRLQQAGS